MIDRMINTGKSVTRHVARKIDTTAQSSLSVVCSALNLANGQPPSKDDLQQLMRMGFELSDIANSLDVTDEVLKRILEE